MMIWDRYKITGIAGILVTAIYLTLAIQIQKPPGLAQDLLGSRAFPIGVGILIGVSSIVLLFMRYQKEEGDEEIGKHEILQLIPYVGIIVLYIALLPFLGTLITTTLFMFMIINKIKRQVWWKDFILSLLIVGAFWLLFVMILKVPLPTGFLRLI